MFRIMLAGMLVLAVPAAGLAQDKEKAKTDKAKTTEKPKMGVAGQSTTAPGATVVGNRSGDRAELVVVASPVPLGWGQMVAAVLLLALTALVLVQLMLLRSDVERLIKQVGGSPIGGR